MWFIDFVTSHVSLDILCKLLIALLLSLIIGIEREVINKPAGIKTHSLICVSSTLVMAIGTYMYNIYGSNIDPSRLPSQIIAGIGFVGAGTIIREGFSVKGITTAASLLAMTCIGLAVGVGFYEGAIYTTLLVFLVLCLTAPLQNFIGKVRKINLFTITVTKSKGAISEIESLFEDKNIPVLSIKQLEATDNSESVLLKFFVKVNNSTMKEELITEICNLPFVKEVYISKKSYHSDIE